MFECVFWSLTSVHLMVGSHEHLLLLKPFDWPRYRSKLVASSGAKRSQRRCKHRTQLYKSQCPEDQEAIHPEEVSYRPYGRMLAFCSLRRNATHGDDGRPEEAIHD